jgi:autotransporter-associated beta strand protein/VCBS repeat-containing protein
MVGALVTALMAPGVAVASGSAPVVTNDEIVTAEDTVATGNVLTNDTDAEDTLIVSSHGNLSADYGTLVLEDDGDFAFTPHPNWSGATSVYYWAYDGTTQRKGYLNLTVTAVNDAPVPVDKELVTNEDTEVTAGSAFLLEGATDVEGGSISVTGVSHATGGTAVYASLTATFTPAANVCGVAAGGFDYTVTDGVDTGTAHVTVDITCLNDSPLASDDTITVAEDAVAANVTAAILANDVDPDNALAITAVGTGTGGGVQLTSGVVTFTPTANLCGVGAGSFTYTLDDGIGTPDTAAVTVNITCVNDLPIVVNETATVAQGSGPIDYNVLANDTDIDGGTLSLTGASVYGGTATIVNGKLRFVPQTWFHGNAVITYVVSDGTGISYGTLTATVTPDVIAPVAVAPSVTFGAGRVNESAPLLVSWSATDAGSRVSAYALEVSIDGAAFTSVYRGSATSVTRFYGFDHRLVWRVRATDHEGNVSAWATSAVRRLYAYQSPGLAATAYTGSWTTQLTAEASGIGSRYTTRLGNRAQLTFTGREVLYVAPKSAAAGYVKVYVDGVRLGRYNTYRATTAQGVIVASKGWGAVGSHTIRIVNDQAGRRTGLDAFIVLR